MIKNKNRIVPLIKLMVTFGITSLLFGCAGNPQYNLIRHGVVVDDIKSVVAAGQTDQVESMSASERVASITDLMVGIKNSKTPDWLMRELGQPNKIIHLGFGHAEWSWGTIVREFGRARYECRQLFYVNTIQNKITGWATNCPAGNYGTVALNAPMTTPADGKILKRTKTFNDYVATRQHYQDITKKYPELTPEPLAMAEGKKRMIFTKKWNTYRYEVDGYEWACDGMMCASWDTYETIAIPHTCQWSVTVDHAGAIIGWDTSQCEFANKEDEQEYGYISTLIPVPPRTK